MSETINTTMQITVHKYHDIPCRSGFSTYGPHLIPIKCFAWRCKDGSNHFLTINVRHYTGYLCWAPGSSADGQDTSAMESYIHLHEQINTGCKICYYNPDIETREPFESHFRVTLLMVQSYTPGLHPNAKIFPPFISYHQEA